MHKGVTPTKFRGDRYGLRRIPYRARAAGCWRGAAQIQRIFQPTCGPATQGSAWIIKGKRYREMGPHPAAALPVCAFSRDQEHTHLI